MHQKIVTYWEGDATWLERLSLLSMLATGHRVEIYTNDVKRLRAQNLHDDLIDIREVMSGIPLADHYRSIKGLPHYTDYVRLELLRLGRGVWADLDCIFLKNLASETPASGYLYGWVSPERINNAVLCLPQESELLDRYYRAITTVPIRVPWATGHIRIKRELEILVGMTIPYNAKRLAIGPRALTYFAKQCNATQYAVPESVFYPIADRDTGLMLDADAGPASRKIAANTVSVHAWRATLRKFGLTELPARTSWLGQQCTRFGI